MELSPIEETILNKVQLTKAGALLWQCDIIKNQRNVKIRICQNGLTQSFQNQQMPHLSLKFQFDVKYSFQLLPPTITFHKCNLKQIYYLNDIQMLKAWRNILKNKLNQKGFEQQFNQLKTLGKGNFAFVFSAFKYEDETTYAVKAFSKQKINSQEKGKQTIMKEIEIMRSLDHNNLMKLWQVYQSDDYFYFVLEQLQGGQLNERLKEVNRFTEAQVKNIMVGLTEGIVHMHEHKIMHRDLKPQNIIFRKSQNLECVIADFGLAQFYQQKQFLFVRCGTPGFVAPEIINIKDLSKTYGQKCDVFSLGLIFHILLFSRSAFNGANYNQVLKQNRRSEFVFEGNQYRKLSSDCLDLLKKMLTKNPEERISAKQVLNHNYLKKHEGSVKRILSSIKNIFITSEKQVSIKNKSQNKKQKNEIEKVEIKKQNEQISIKKQKNEDGVLKRKISAFHENFAKIKDKILFFR